MDSTHIQRVHEKKRVARLVGRNGSINIQPKRISGKKRKFAIDFVTTLVDIQWRYNIFIFVTGFVISWLIFATYYWLISYIHGDFDTTTHLPPCVQNLKSFVSAYLFSIETMSTIGYGFRYVTEECPAVFVGVFVQSILGAGLQVALAGLVIAKIRRSKKRSATMIFSKVACIMEQDLKLQLVFRVGDMRKSHIVNANARAILIEKTLCKKRINNVPIQSHNVDFKAESGSHSLFMAWPTNIIHVIDEKSPFWNMTHDDLAHETSELVVMLQGVVASTGKAFQASTSYLPHDIIWGHRFHTLGPTMNESGSHIVDFGNFHKTYPIPTPWCSAKMINDFLASTGRQSPSILLSRVDVRESEHKRERHKSGNDTFLGLDVQPRPRMSISQ